jgi:hypothetical protein
MIDALLDALIDTLAPAPVGAMPSSWHVTQSPHGVAHHRAVVAARALRALGARLFETDEQRVDHLRATVALWARRGEIALAARIALGEGCRYAADALDLHISARTYAAAVEAARYTAAEAARSPQ